MDFSQYLVGGIPLLFVVLGLVEWVKLINVPSKALPFVSMGIGLIFGSGYQISVSGVPLDFAAWFSMIFFGLAIGIVASGLYDVAKGLLTKAIDALKA